MNEVEGYFVILKVREVLHLANDVLQVFLLFRVKQSHEPFVFFTDPSIDRYFPVAHGQCICHRMMHDRFSIVGSVD
ncbi:MAG TPA: hypothetical protein VN214_07175, partial [Pseudomonas sp.]|nr:hypothetical protein [Pseudomonas sp.]